MDRMKLRDAMKKYRYVILVLLAGMALMLLPTDAPEETEPVREEAPEADLQIQLEQILSRIQGAGEVAVLLTQEYGAETLYQTEGEDGKTVLVTTADRAEEGLVRTTRPPAYRGAIVVCRGADSAAVRLAVVEAVANVTGLGTDKITVLKME